MTAASPTPPHGILTIGALRLAVETAKKRATTSHDVGLVKTASEAVRAYWASGRGYDARLYREAVKALVALEAIALQPIAPAPVAAAVFVPSASQPGVFYKVVGGKCTCPAAQHGRACRHLAEAAKQGEGR